PGAPRDVDARRGSPGSALTPPDCAGPEGGPGMRYITGFFRFWYDFLVGDSWQLTAGVVLVVAATRQLIIAMPQLAPAAGPGFFLSILAVFCGLVLSESRQPHTSD